MIYHIDWNESEAEKLLVLSLVAQNAEYDAILTSLLSNDFVQKASHGFELTEKGANYLSASSWFDDTGEIVKELRTRLEEKKVKTRALALAKKLMPLWPSGIRRNIGKQGLSASWRGNSIQVAARLAMIPEVLEYSDEQILRAARAYLRLFEDDQTYMKGLLNFVLKREDTTFDDGPDSALLEMLEQVDDLSKKRKNQLR